MHDNIGKFSKHSNIFKNIFNVPERILFGNYDNTFRLS